MKTLIINADDFGMTESCTAAIIKAFSERKITSTTMCANGHYFSEAVKLISKEKLENKIGIHLNVTEGKPLTEKIRNDSFFCDKMGVFHGRINRIKLLTNIQKELIYNEFDAQIKRIKSVGIVITHSDSHHHIHTAPNITVIAIQALKTNNIQKIRISRNIGKIPFIKRVSKNIYNQIFLSKNFVSTELFGSMKDVESKIFDNRDKSLEIMVHPDFNKNNKLVDRIDFDEDGYPIGNEMNLQEDFLYKYNLCSYYDLVKGERK